MYSPFIKNHIYTDLLPPPPPPSKCPTLSDPMDCSPPGSYVHGIFQARVLEWVAIAFSVPPEKSSYFFLEKLSFSYISD